MEKLTIKELAPYLPYGLKFKSEDGIFEITRLETQSKLSTKDLFYRKIYPIWANNTCEFNKEYLHKKSLTGKGHDFKQVKPILRPLSDLTKDYVSKIMKKYFTYEIEIERDLQKIGMLVYNPLYCNYSIVEALLSEHFDIFGLIEKGLAIDINKL